MHDMQQEIVMPLTIKKMVADICASRGFPPLAFYIRVHEEDYIELKFEVYWKVFTRFADRFSLSDISYKLGKHHATVRNGIRRAQERLMASEMLRTRYGVTYDEVAAWHVTIIEKAPIAGRRYITPKMRALQENQHGQSTEQHTDTRTPTGTEG